MPELSTWGPTIPQGRPAVTISTNQLQRDYHSDYLQRITDGIHFRVPVNGSHTRNSEFPRSELCRILSSGRSYNWRYARTNNWLGATLCTEVAPSTRHMIIGQIHNDNSNSDQTASLVKLFCQLRSDQGRVQALVRERPDDGGTGTYAPMDGIPFGQSSSYCTGVSRSGLLSVSMSGSALKWRLDSQWAHQGLYFKAGLYLQDSRGPSSEGRRVTFSELCVSHQWAVEVSAPWTSHCYGVLQLPDLAGTEEREPGAGKNIRTVPRENKSHDPLILVLQYMKSPWQIAPSKCHVLCDALSGLYNGLRPSRVKSAIAAVRRSSLRVKSLPSITAVGNYCFRLFLSTVRSVGLLPIFPPAIVFPTFRRSSDIQVSLLLSARTIHFDHLSMWRFGHEKSGEYPGGSKCG